MREVSSTPLDVTPWSGRAWGARVDGKQLQLIGVALREVSSTSLDVAPWSGRAFEAQVFGFFFHPKMIPKRSKMDLKSVFAIFVNFWGLVSGWLREWILSDLWLEFGSILASEIDEQRKQFREFFLKGLKRGRPPSGRQG